MAPDYIFTISVGGTVLFYLMAFALGDFLQLLVARPHLGRGFTDSAVSVAIDPRLRIVALIMGGLSLIGAIWYASYFTSFYGSLQNLFTAGWSIRGDIANGSIDVPVYIRMLLLLAYPCYCLSLTQWILGGPLWWSALPSCSLFLMAASQSGRAGLLILCFLFFFSYLIKERIRSKRLRWVKTFVVGGVIGLLILGIFMAGGAYRAQSFDVIDLDNAQLTSAKVYAFGAVSSFASYLQSSNHADLGFGAWSFASLFQLLGLHSYELGYYTDYLPISNADSNLTTNVYTIFRSAIDDFGFIGAAIYFCFMGAVFGCFFRGALVLKPGSVAQSVVAAGFLAYSVFAPLSQHTALLLCFLIPPFFLNRLVKIQLLRRRIPEARGSSRSEGESALVAKR